MLLYALSSINYQAFPLYTPGGSSCTRGAGVDKPRLTEYSPLYAPGGSYCSRGAGVDKSRLTECSLFTPQVGVPVHVARVLTYPEKVTEHNLRLLRTLVVNGADTHPGSSPQGADGDVLPAALAGWGGGEMGN